MEDRPEYVIYYLSNRLKYLEEHRPIIYHVYDPDGTFNCTISSEKAAQECIKKGMDVKEGNLDEEILKVTESLMSYKLKKFINDSLN